MKKNILLSLHFIVLSFFSQAQKGPGFGNLQYNSNEVFKNIWLYKDPTHYGSNIATMVNGYLVMTFTPDSGQPPGGLLVFDVSNPRSPQLITRVYDNRTSTLREAHAIGNYQNYIAIQDGCGFQIWDMSNGKNPVQVKRFCVPGYKHDDYGSAWQLFWQAPYMYIANGAAGFDVIDVTDINNPVYVKHVNIGMQAGPIFAVGNLLITLAHDTGRGYAVIDIGDPKNPKLLNTSSGTENLYAGFVNGNRIISSARGNAINSTFSVHDFTDPYNIKLAGKLNIGNAKEQLYNTTQDQYIFQGCQDEIVKIDATDVAALKVIGRGGLDITGDKDHGQVTPLGNLIFVGNDHGSGNGFIVHQAAPDTKGPEVNMVNPRPNSVNRALTSRIGITLTDSPELSTVNNQTFIIRPKGGQALTGKYSHQFSILNFTPDKPLLPNTTYEIVVPAGGFKDWSGNTVSKDFSSFFSTGPSGDFPPAAAENLMYTEFDGRIVLNWNKVSGANNYVIKRSDAPGGPFTAIGNTAQASYEDTKVTNGIFYYYQIFGENTYGEGIGSSVIKAMPALYVTDLVWTNSKNNWGPVEIDQSNGETATDDGRLIVLNGQLYTRGLGTHAPSEVTYNLKGDYKRFISDIGIDDEVGTSGSAFFQVMADGKEIYKSTVMNGSSNTKTIDVSVANVKELKLITSTDSDVSLDHTSWAGARLVPTGTTGIEQLDKNSIAVYHNSNLDQLVVNSDQQLIEDMKVIDMSGRIIYGSNESFTGTKTYMLNGKLKSGIYILTFQSKNFIQSKKLIIL